MVRKIIILAVTKSYGDVCVAGVDEQRNWIRPTRLVNPRIYLKKDLFDDPHNAVVALSNKVSIWFNSHIPDGDTPHQEDWEYDNSHKPKLIEALDDNARLRLFNQIAEQNMDAILARTNRSLCLIKPTKIISVNFSRNPFDNKYKPKLFFNISGNTYEYKVTDLYWRAIGRKLLSQGHQILNGNQLQSLLEYREIFLSIGLSRFFTPPNSRGNYWPMVIGVHLIPAYNVEIDYYNP